MASVLYDLHMICWLFVWRKSEAVRSGVGVVKNLEPGVILAERKSYLFSPDYEKIGPLPLRRQGSFSIK